MEEQGWPTSSGHEWEFNELSSELITGWEQYWLLCLVLYSSLTSWFSKQTGGRLSIFDVKFRSVRAHLANSTWLLGSFVCLHTLDTNTKAQIWLNPCRKGSAEGIRKRKQLPTQTRACQFFKGGSLLPFLQLPPVCNTHPIIHIHPCELS